MLARLLATLVPLALLIPACALTSADDGADEGVGLSSNAISGALRAGDKLVTTSRLNLREGPSTSTDILETMAVGEVVTLLEGAPTGAFYHVQHEANEGWIHGNYVRKADARGGDDEPAAPAASDGAFNGRSYSGVTMLWQGNWSFLVRCDSYSRSRGRVVFYCDESPSRSFVDDGNWIAVPRAYFSRSLCGDEARVCKGTRCVTAKVVERSETGSKWEGSSSVMEALGVDVGFSGCSSSFGTATGVNIRFR